MGSIAARFDLSENVANQRHRLGNTGMGEGQGLRQSPTGGAGRTGHAGSAALPVYPGKLFSAR